MQVTFWQRARYWVLLLLVFLITISSHPTIAAMSRDAGMESGTILSRYIILVFGGLFIMCVNFQSMMRAKLVRVSLIIYFFVFLYYLITRAAFGEHSMMSDVRSMAICLVAIMIGWQLNLDEKRFHIMLLAFAGLTLFVGLMQVFMNIGGFVILDQYETDNKNSLGVMLSTSAIVFLFLGLNRQQRGIIKTLCFVLALLTLVVLLTIRARAATLTTGIMLLYILYERFKGKDFFIYLIIGLVLVVALFVFMPSSIKDYVYHSFTQHYEEGDITTGRLERNAVALSFLSNHIFFGNLDQNIRVAQIHNYPLNRTFEFGIVFVFPIMLLYLYILINTIVKTIKSNNRYTQNIGYYLLLIPFIISMAEPTFPFGPGTATVINFVTFGLALRYSYNARFG